MEVRQFVGRIRSARRALAAVGSMPVPVLRITNGLAMISLVLSFCHLFCLCSDKERPLRFPLGGRGFATVLCKLASVVYLLNLFGGPSSGQPSDDEGSGSTRRERAAAADAPTPMHVGVDGGDEEIIAAVVSGTLPSHHLESRFGTAAARPGCGGRRSGGSRGGVSRGSRSMEWTTYKTILGQCCEMPVGYVQVPVGVVGPLLLHGRQYHVPIATTEGYLVASVNRGCRAIATSGGTVSALLRYAMSCAPVVKLPSAKWAAELKSFVEAAANFENMASVFNR